MEAATGVEAGADDEREAELAGSIDRRATTFVDALIAAGADSLRIERHAAEVDRLGAAEIFGSTQVTRRVLDQDMQLASSLASRKGATAEGLRAVRELVAGLEPGRFDLDDASGSGAGRYAAQAERAEQLMAEPLAVLNQARARLQHENAVIAQEERSLWLQMHALRGYARLAQALDETLERRIGEVQATRPDQARLLQTEALLPIRRRRQDLLTHLTVAAQGYAALRTIERTNESLIRAIDTAATTTVAAVRAAALAARAVTTAERVERGLASLGIGEELAEASLALDAVDRTKLTVLEAVRSALRAVHEEAVPRASRD